MTKQEQKKENLKKELKIFLLDSIDKFNCSVYKDIDEFSSEFADYFYSKQIKAKKCFNEVLDTCKV